MLNIKNINIQFHNKTILKDTDFSACQSQITIIYSKSGYGKTSLLNLINNASSHYKSYTINDISIHKDNVRDYVSLSPQTPIFINSLTIKENILLYLRLNNVELDENMFQYLVDQLHIKNQLSQYPQSLSGGELRKVSLVSQILLNKPVILMDEPTASLDQEYIEIIKKIISNLKDCHKIIIISTHDKNIQDMGDRIYEIKDQSLNLVKEMTMTQGSINKIPKSSLSYLSIDRILKKKKHHQKIKNSLMTIMTAIIVTLLGFSLIYGQGTIDALNEQLNSSIPNQMIVYKQICEETDEYDPFEVPIIKDNELTYLKNHQYIQEIKPYHHGKLLTDDSEKNNIIVIDHQSNEEEIIIDENDVKITFANYYKDMDYSKQVIKKYNDDGVYISEDLANILKIDENHTKIKFHLAIPHSIQSPGGYVSFSESEDKYYHVDFLDCVSEYVEMDIAGIYRDGYMGIYEMTNGNGYGRIYVENSVYEKYIHKYKLEKDFTQDCTNTFICKTTHIYPYNATSYIVTYDVEHIEELLNDLYHQGFRYVNDYHDTSLLISSQQKNTQMIRLFSVIVFVVGCIVLLSVKYVQREETKQTFKLISSQNILKKDYYKISSIQWIKDTLFIWIVASFLGYLLSVILNRTLISYTEFHFISVFIMLLISFVVCVLIPFLSDYFILRYEEC